ncbi:uncharacterized protein RBU57_012354 isoform 2-T2 [Macrochelys suwanniensis]
MNSDTIRRFNVVDLVAGPNTVEDPLGEPLLRNSSSFGVFCSRYEESSLADVMATRNATFMDMWSKEEVAIGSKGGLMRPLRTRLKFQASLCNWNQGGARPSDEVSPVVDGGCNRCSGKGGPVSTGDFSEGRSTCEAAKDTGGRG